MFFGKKDYIQDREISYIDKSRHYKRYSDVKENM